MAHESPVVLGGESRPCLIAPTPAEMRFRVKVPPRSSLTFAVGIVPPPTGDAEDNRTGKVLFQVSAGREAPDEIVFSREIHVSRSDQWIDQLVDLSRFSGEEVWIHFETAHVGGDESTARNTLGLFAEPVLHDRRGYGTGRTVVIVSIDTLRRDHASLYEYHRKTTPGLEDLGSEAVVFDDAVSPSSWTLPAHASLFTSLYPSFHGAVTLHKGLSNELTGLPRLLDEQGFFTQAIVTHLYLSEQYGFGTGFDRLLYMPETRAEQVTDRAIGVLRSRGDRDLFLFLHYYDPHWHYDPPSPYDRTFDPDYSGSTSGIWWDFKEHTLESMNPRDLQHILALYDGEILYTDHHLERFFQEMKRLEMFDEALIVVTSDHGEEFLDHGGWEHQKTLYEEQLRVPLIVKFPRGEGRGRRVSAQVSLLDIAPTIVEYLGLSSPPSFQGRNLLPIEEIGNDIVWSETEHTLDGSHKLSMRRGSGREKLIFSLLGRKREDSIVELYDLPNDPVERTDLAATTPDTVNENWTRLVEFLDTAIEWEGSSVPVELTPEQLDKLRLLGYATEPPSRK
jgi:arylsulfatase A-like enzyme